ncbi:hypothetical protein RB195_004094 [Necator americanus]|uniref:Uncharacterized protein n=1 Tax=Necator americanus TaxID=51031 RepID=A0ABR1BKB5_NECAM
MLSGESKLLPENQRNGGDPHWCQRCQEFLLTRVDRRSVKLKDSSNVRLKWHKRRERKADISGWQRKLRILVVSKPPQIDWAYNLGIIELSTKNAKNDLPGVKMCGLLDSLISLVSHGRAGFVD